MCVLSDVGLVKYLFCGFWTCVPRRDLFYDSFFSLSLSLWTLQHRHHGAKNTFKTTSEVQPLALSGCEQWTPVLQTSASELETLVERFWDLLSASCWVGICASVYCLLLCTSEAEASVIHMATSGEKAGCSLSGQTMWVSYLTSSNRTWQ